MVYCKWSRAFLEAGENGLTRETLRDANSEEVKQLESENEQLKQSLVETVVRYYKYQWCYGIYGSRFLKSKRLSVTNMTKCYQIGV